MAHREEPSIFKSLLVALIFGYVAYSIEPTDSDMAAVRIFCAFIAAYAAWSVVRNLPNPVYNWLKRRRARKASNRHGTARWAIVKDIMAYGLHKVTGLFLGVWAGDGRPLFLDGEGHCMVYAPTRSGKTRNLVIPNILNYYSSMLITDIKGELWNVTSGACRSVQKNKIYRLDPAGLKNSTHGKAHRFNPLSLIIVAWKSGRHSDVIFEAKDIAKQFLPEPKVEGENSYFPKGSRKVMVFAIIYLVVTSEKEVNLTMVVALIQNNLELEDALRIATCSDALSGELASRAQSLLRTLEEKDSTHWQSFCEGAEQVLDIYGASGLLAESTSTSDFNFSELKGKEPCKIYILVDPTRMDVLAPWLGLIVWCMLKELLSSDSRREVILMLDETANFRVDGLVEKLTILAGYQCRAITVLQSFSAFEKTYSRQDLDILLDQCECKIWLKVQSYRVAEMLSKSLGSATQVNEHYHMGHDYRDLAQDSLGEMPRPLMTPDEVMRTPYAIIQLRGKYPILAETIGYDAVKPWNKWAGINTLYGNKPFVSKTRIKLRYPSLAWWSTCFGLIKRTPKVVYYRRIRHKRDWSNLPFALIHTVRALLLLAPVLVLWWAIETYGTPHVLWEYTYRGYASNLIKERCTYIGIDGQKTRFGPNCPFVKFIKDDAL